MTTQPKQYYSATELVNLIGTTKMTLHRWERDPEVNLPKPVRIKSTRYYPIAEIEQWLDGARG